MKAGGAFLMGCLLLFAFPLIGFSAELQDLIQIPQQGRQYLPISADKPILTVSEQQLRAQQYLNRHFSPWDGNGFSHLNVTKEQIIAFQRSAIQRGGWGSDRKPISKETLNGIKKQITVPFASLNRNGIALMESDLRVLPTKKTFYPPSYTPSSGYSFDRLQNSTIKPGKPLRLLHLSLNGSWVFVSSGTAVGWVEKNKVTDITDAFITAWKELPQGVFIKDNTALKSMQSNRTLAIAKLGTLLPLKNSTPLLPVKTAGGETQMEPIKVIPESYAPFPLPFNARNATEILEAIGPERYGWGGSLGLRDCSAMTRDYFTVFGIWLPRNSADQAKMGAVTSVETLPASKRGSLLRQKGIPFATLVHLPGHIMLYVGQHQEKPIVFHNLWGIHILKNKKPDRYVIGRTIFSTLRPGAEFPNRMPKRLLEDRIDSFNTLTITEEKR